MLFSCKKSSFEKPSRGKYDVDSAASNWCLLILVAVGGNNGESSLSMLMSSRYLCAMSPFVAGASMSNFGVPEIISTFLTTQRFRCSCLPKIAQVGNRTKLKEVTADTLNDASCFKSMFIFLLSSVVVLLSPHYPLSWKLSVNLMAKISKKMVFSIKFLLEWVAIAIFCWAHFRFVTKWTIVQCKMFPDFYAVF